MSTCILLLISHVSSSTCSVLVKWTKHMSTASASLRPACVYMQVLINEPYTRKRDPLSNTAALRPACVYMYVFINLWFEKWTQGGSIGLALLWSKKKKRNITLSFTSPEKEKYFWYIYEVIVKQKKKRSTNHYSYTHTCTHVPRGAAAHQHLHVHICIHTHMRTRTAMCCCPSTLTCTYTYTYTHAHTYRDVLLPIDIAAQIALEDECGRDIDLERVVECRHSIS